MPSALAIIGAGRVGQALGRRLHELGWRVGVVTTRSTSTARAAVRAIGAGRPTDRLTRLVLSSDVVLIATGDSVIREVAAELARLGGNEWPGKVVLHTSGALDSSVLAPLSRAGAATGSIHPMQTFSGQSAPDLSRCVFGIEGSGPALRVARRMIRQMGGIAVRLSGENKAGYHAAGSLACSHVLTLVEAATRLLMAQGFSRRQASRALLPMTRQMLDNFERLGPRAAWTGPMARGDYATVERHAGALTAFPKEYLLAYAAVSRLSAVLLSEDSKRALQNLELAITSGQKGRNGSGLKLQAAAK
jgi:predicted short-subunit dehydrogenase-like oxidoreductase (DUF2520 family)